MNIKVIENKAAELMERVGGKIFAFPVNEQDPLSLYAVTLWTGAEFKTFPNALIIEEAAAGIREILKGLEESGLDHDYDRLVRFISYDAQINGPSITMRRLQKENSPTGYLKQGDDISPSADSYKFTARGLIKFSYLQMIDDDLPKAAEFMSKFYELLETRRYGKTAAAIKQEVRRMSKDAAIKWIEQTYAKHIKDPRDIIEIFNGMKGA